MNDPEDEPAVPGRSCAVLGDPIEHSLSPALHQAAYEDLGLEGWTYGTYRVNEGSLDRFLDLCDDRWRGLSLTKPLKAAALAAGEPDEVAALAGGANTLIFETDGRRRAYNTDVEGLRRALRSASTDPLPHVLLVGGGATARSALVSVVDLGCRRATVAVRRPEQGEQLRPLADRLGIELVVIGLDVGLSGGLPAADAAVSTVTAAAADPLAHDIAAAAPLVFDVVYDPWPTPLHRAAEAAGAVTVNGLDLLAEQAALQVELMTGRSVSAELLRAAGAAELRERARAR